MRFDSASESKGKKRNKYNASEAGPRSAERIKNIKEKTSINYFNRLNYLEIMKKYLLFATAILAFASCADNNYLGTEENLRLVEGDRPIAFGTGLNAVTRADKTGAEAAEDLNGQFFVWGIKKEATDGIAAAATGNLVYKNYVVKWADNSAYTTTSNTQGWEYVGYTLTAKEQANVLANSGAAVQTIKYWDYGAADYTFYAFSADPLDISGDKITAITKTESVTSPKTVYDKGYTLTVAAGANLDKLYFAERVNISKSTNTNRDLDNSYGGNVTFRFHNTATKVRVAMYETIPGYSVTINKFSVDNDGADPEFSAMTDDVTTNFAANLQHSPKGVAGSMVVTYVADAGATQNWPVVKFTPTAGATKVLALGNGLKADVTLGESVGAATYDKTDNLATPGVDESYTSVFPNEENAQNLKLKLSYTLKAPITNETITVTNATAEIPAEYLKWKPGFAYTYIFKISDNTNGSSGTPGTDPAGLYPITFDAVEVIADDGKAEYITTVSEPTITTFGVKAGKYVHDGSEYEAGSDIYATFTEGSTVKTPTLGGSGAQHVNVFKVTTPDATNFPITEASVAEAIANPGSITNNVYTCTVAYTKVTDASTLAGSTNYYKADSESRVPGATGYVATLAVSETDYHVDDVDPANSTMAVDIYTVAVTSVTEVTDATTLAAGTTYYKKDTNTKAPGADGYIPTIAVEGTDYEVAPKIKAVNINSDASTNFTAVPAVVETVPGEDGINITIDALKLTGVKAGTYAIEYEASAAWTGSYKKVYKVIVVQ